MATTFGNTSSATLASGINNSVTTITLNAALPEPASGTCNAVLTDASGHVEYVAITAGLGTTSLTVTRASESASRYPARAWLTGDTITHVATAADLNGAITSFTLAGDGGSSQSITNGNTLTVSGGSGLASTASATDTVTVDLDVNSLTADATPDSTADYVATYDASASAHKKVLLQNLPGAFEWVSFIIDGGGSAITTGIKGDFVVPKGTIVEARLLADQSGSIVVDLWKDTYANYPPVVGDSITASAKPTISSATKTTDTTLTGWTTSLVDGDSIRVNVDSITTIQRCTVALKVRR